jgi:type IV pilus biogenesis protein PilP
MQNKFKYLVFLSSLALSGVVLAESASDNLTRIEEETLILKARERQLEVQAKIIAKQNEIAFKQAETEHISQPPVVGNPLIHSVEGIGAAMFATLQLDNGNIVDVQVGDVLSNGMRIVSIRPNEVMVETQKKKRIRLSTVSNTPAVFNPNFPSAGLALPPPLPMAIPRGAGK